MKKFLIGAALATSALMAAAPASAQYYPQAPQGYGYGYNNNGYGQSRNLLMRVQRLRMQIRQLEQRNILSERSAERLEENARDLQRRIQQSSYTGLDWRQSQYFESRLARLEQAIRIQANDANRWERGNNGGYGYGVPDRDRDGRDDRYEGDRGQEQDGNWNR